MNSHEQFQRDVTSSIEGLQADVDLQALSRIWIREVTAHRWAYNFSWLGRPAIQFPNDAWALQEIIWKVRPDLIIETGIAHGGSLIFSASMLALLDLADAAAANDTINPRSSNRKVLGVDIDIRPHNRAAIEQHPLSSNIRLIQGSSISAEVIAEVQKVSAGYSRILVCLDSNQTHDHVLEELKAYAPMTSVGSYCVVFDTIIEDMPKDFFPDRPWGIGNNPKTAVREFIETHPEFQIDQSIHNKLLITVAQDGYLKRIR